MFLKYSSLENGYRQKFADNAQCLGVADWKVIKRSISRIAGDIVRENFLNIIDGTF